MKLEIEYNAELDEYFIVIPETILNRLGWEESDLIEYDLDDEVLRLFKI